MMKLPKSFMMLLTKLTFQHGKVHQHEINWKLIQRNKLRAKGRVRAHHFVVYEEVNLMAFPSEEEQLRKFRNDEVAQHYFEVLRTLISKKSIFAQNIGL